MACLAIDVLTGYLISELSPVGGVMGRKPDAESFSLRLGAKPRFETIFRIMKALNINMTVTVSS